MSGSTIGGVVGGVVGFVVSGFNPYGFQVGFMIGSAVGGYVDPDVIKGPRLNDAQVQTSMEGAPRPIVYGVSAVAGNIIQAGPLVETKRRKRTGKGGPVQETYHYSRSYAIRICEGPIAGISRVWRDDKLVYDTRNPADWPDDPNVGVIDTDSAKIASIMTFYLGDESQLPDPTLEALPAAYGGGVGNVPAYRGTAYVVFANDDLTERQGTVPQYRFEVVSTGTTTTQPATVDAKQFASDVLPWATDAHLARDPRKTGVVYEYGYLPNGLGYEATVWGFDSPEDSVDAAIIAGEGAGADYISLTLRGWTEFEQIDGDTSNGAIHPIYPWSGLSLDANSLNAVGLVFGRYPSTIEHDGTTNLISGSDSCPTFHEAVWSYSIDGGTRNNTATYIRSYYVQPGAGSDDGFVNCFEGGVINGTGSSGGAGSVRMYGDFIVLCRPIAACISEPDSEWLAIPDAPGWYTDPDGETFHVPTCTPVSGSYKQLALNSTVGATDPTVLTLPQGPTLEVGDPDDTQTFWDAAYAAAVAAGWMASGKTYQADGLGGTNTYPRVISEACECAPALPQVSIDQVVLSYVVTDLCGRVGLDASQLEVSQLTDIVPGFTVGTQMSASAAIKTLQSGYFFDFPEWDKQLHGIKRGGVTLFDIPEDDLVEYDDDQETRAQAVEFPRKINLIVPDSSADYNPTKQTVTRNTDNIRAVGETTAELPINFSRDEAAQKAAIMLKMAWTDAEGRITRMLPEEYTRLTPSDPFLYGGKRWRADRVEYADGTVKVEAIRDRASVYTSSATAGTVQPPTAPISSTKGPTVFTAMNLPSLKSADNVPGMYIAAQGILAGWQGAEIQMSVDGGLTYQSVAVITDPATIGTLTSAATASGQPIGVKLYLGGELESVTDTQLAARENGFAIITDGVAEIGQFKTATETAPREYDLTTLLDTPSGVTLTRVLTGGTLAAATYSYRVAAKTAAGSTLASTAVTIATTDTTSQVIIEWDAVDGATGYDVYGRTGGSELLIASTTDTTYTDTGSVTPSGVLPGSNTAERNLRGLLNTTAAAHNAGDQFVLLDGAVLFLPLDIGLAGQTIKIRPVSIGTAPENNPVYDVVFDPQFTSPDNIQFLLDEAGENLLDEAGLYLTEG